MIENTKNQGTIKITGGCHCGAVQFNAWIDPTQRLLDCNCSLCAMTGHLHMMAKHQDFTLIRGRDRLNSYRFNTQQAEHLFCSVCGIKSFYQPRSHPDSWSINARCVDGFDKKSWQIDHFDGRNWERAKSQLKEQSKT